MSLNLIGEPIALAVSLDEARRAARVDVNVDGTSELDPDIALAVRAATTEAEHYMGRAVIEQTWELTLDAFPAAFELSKPPLMSVLYVKFYDTNGVLQTLYPQDYQVDAKKLPGWIVPAPGKAWPATASRINAVEVQFTCGYGADESAVPAAIKAFILGRVQEQFAPPGTSKNEYLFRKLDPLKVY